MLVPYPKMRREDVDGTAVTAEMTSNGLIRMKVDGDNPFGSVAYMPLNVVEEFAQDLLALVEAQKEMNL